LVFKAIVVNLEPETKAAIYAFKAAFDLKINQF
jgi:hypothetical protein